jgi:uncharacterized membrane protein
MEGNRTAAEYRRLRAYEGLLVLAVVVLAAIVVGSATAVALMAPLRAVARSLGTTP